jgi:hypothetical protein
VETGRPDLGEISPIGRLLSFGQFFEDFKRCTNFWATFLRGTSYASIFFQKMVLATFLAIFSQTHLVTLRGEQQGMLFRVDRLPLHVFCN